MEQSFDKRNFVQYKKTEITLSEEQHPQMYDVMDVVDQVAANDLQHISEEGEIHYVGNKKYAVESFRKIKLQI